MAARLISNTPPEYNFLFVLRSETTGDTSDTTSQFQLPLAHSGICIHFGTPIPSSYHADSDVTPASNNSVLRNHWYRYPRPYPTTLIQTQPSARNIVTVLSSDSLASRLPGHHMQSTGLRIEVLPCILKTLTERNS